MANAFIQYLHDTRAELRHVAWPTRVQTIVYSILVAGISVGIAIYLGLFDFVFTGALERFLQVLPGQTPSSVQQQANPITVTPTGTAPAAAPATPPAAGSALPNL